MDKPGSQNMTLGLVWLIGGALLTAGSFSLFDGEAGVLFYGAILVGGIQFVVGVFQRMHYATMPENKKAQIHAEASIITLLRCMAMVANADGKIGETEVATIAEIYERVLGSPIPLETLRNIVAKVGDGGADPAEFVASKGTQVPVEFRPLIAKACYMVMSSDGEISKSEENMLRQILSGLQLPRDLFTAQMRDS